MILCCGNGIQGPGPLQAWSRKSPPFAWVEIQSPSNHCNEPRYVFTESDRLFSTQTPKSPASYAHSSTLAIEFQQWHRVVHLWVWINNDRSLGPRPIHYPSMFCTAKLNNPHWFSPCTSKGCPNRATLLLLFLTSPLSGKLQKTCSLRGVKLLSF